MSSRARSDQDHDAGYSTAPISSSCFIVRERHVQAAKSQIKSYNLVTRTKMHVHGTRFKNQDLVDTNQRLLEQIAGVT